MKYLIIDEDGDVRKVEVLTNQIIDMVKSGEWIVIDVENKTVGVRNKDFTDIIWKEIPDYTSL